MSETIVRIFTESGTAITFISELDLQEVLTDVEGYASGQRASSSTILAGLLRDGMTRPISGEEDLRLATVIFSATTWLLKWCNEGQQNAFTKLCKTSS